MLWYRAVKSVEVIDSYPDIMHFYCSTITMNIEATLTSVARATEASCDECERFVICYLQRLLRFRSNCSANVVNFQLTRFQQLSTTVVRQFFNCSFAPFTMKDGE